MNIKLFVAAGAIAVIIAIGLASIFLAGGAPVALLHGPAWKTAYERCLGKNGAAAGMPSICGSVADAVNGLPQDDGAQTPKNLPAGYEPRKTSGNRPDKSSMEQYESLLARDPRIFRSSKPAPKSGDVDQSLPVGNDRLQVVAGCPDEAGNPDLCQSLIWHGKMLLSDRYVTIMGAFPSSGVPAIVNVTNYGGGTCCVPTANIIDLTQPEPAVLPLPDLGDDLEFRLISPTLLVLSGTDTSETDPDGDPLTTNYLYHLDRKFIVFAPFDGKTDFGPMVDESAGLLLADATYRKPLSDVLGDRLKEFRQYVAVSPPGTLLNYRYLTGEGCMAHACNEAGGMYVIDIATGDATALWHDNGGALQTAGKAPTDSDVRQLVRNWLVKAGYVAPDDK